jgi:hypothetical protein
MNAVIPLAIVFCLKGREEPLVSAHRNLPVYPIFVAPEARAVH